MVVALSACIINPFGLQPDASKAIAVAFLIIIWWVTEALPMPAVAMVPLVLLPLLKISTIEEVAKAHGAKG